MLVTNDGELSYTSIPDFNLYRHLTRTFQDVAGYNLGGPDFNIAGDQPEQVQGLHITIETGKAI